MGQSSLLLNGADTKSKTLAEKNTMVQHIHRFVDACVRTETMRGWSSAWAQKHRSLQPHGRKCKACVYGAVESRVLPRATAELRVHPITTQYPRRLKRSQYVPRTKQHPYQSIFIPCPNSSTNTNSYPMSQQQEKAGPT